MTERGRRNGSHSQDLLQTCNRIELVNGRTIEGADSQFTIKFSILENQNHIQLDPVQRMRHQDENKLLQLIAGGDACAFRILYEHYSPFIYSFIKKYLRSPELSDDICQNVFVMIWEQREKLSAIHEFSAYAFTLAKRQSIDFLRRASHEQTAMGIILNSYPTESNPPDNGQQVREYMIFIEQVLERMPVQTRQVFKLCRQECKSYEEAATELGISRNAIKKHMVRSMRTLKEAAKNELGISYTTLLIFFSSIL